MLINAGLNIGALSARLGRSNTSTTINICSNALKSDDKVVADKMESILFGKGTKKMQNKHKLLFLSKLFLTLYYVN